MLLFRSTFFILSLSAVSSMWAQVSLNPLPLLSEPSSTTGQASSTNRTARNSDALNALAAQIAEGIRRNEITNGSITNGSQSVTTPSTNDSSTATSNSSASSSSANPSSDTSSRTASSVAGVPTVPTVVIGTKKPANNNASGTIPLIPSQGTSSQGTSSQEAQATDSLESSAQQIAAQIRGGTTTNNPADAQQDDMLEQTSAQMASNILSNQPDVTTTSVTPANSVQLVSPLVVKQNNNAAQAAPEPSSPSVAVSLPVLPTADSTPPAPTVSAIPRRASRPSTSRGSSRVVRVPAVVAAPLPPRQAPADPSQLNAPPVIQNILTIGTAPQIITRQPTQSIRDIIRPAEDFAEEMPAATSQNENYVVQRGDYLTAIARNLYGSDAYLPIILQANPQLKNNPDLITPGMVLVIPRQ